MQGVGIVVFSLGGKPLTRCIRGLGDLTENTVLIIDGNNQAPVDKSKFKNVITFAKEKYPSACYNVGIRELLKDESIEHIFLLNDSIEIIDETVFEDYINTSKKMNLKCLYYCVKEDDPFGEDVNVRMKLDVKDDTVSLNYGTSGGFVYTHTDVYEKVGFLDERYRAAMEWSDFAYRVSQKNLSTPFLWFPSLESAKNKIVTNVNNDKRYEEDFEDRLVRGMKIFYLKFKCEIKDLVDTFSKQDVIDKLKKKVRTV
tara:strand:- start:2133 stop:2900 length:768 start_codon:yes stop_codon:yes gene_type:complete